MKLILLDGYGKNPLDEISINQSMALSELFSQTIGEICADSLSRFWCIDSVGIVTCKTGKTDSTPKLPCFKSVSSVFKTFGKSLSETTFVVAQTNRMMLPDELPVFQSVRLLQPCFLCDDENKKVICIIKGSVLSDIASRRSPRSINELYNMLKTERIKTSVFPVRGEFSPLKTVESFKKYAFKLIKSEIFDNIKESQDGVFYVDKKPSGKFIAVPPVYFGKNVQIETGAVIGPSAIIGDCCLVSEGARVENAILESDVYISKDCYINGAVIGEGASLRRNCAVLRNTVIGAQSLIGEGAVIENDCNLSHSSIIGNDYDYFSIDSDGFSEKLLIDGQYHSPEDAAAIGKKFALFTEGAETAVINDGTLSSYLLKNAFIAGASFENAKIIDCGEASISQCVAVGAILNTDFTVFISYSQSMRFAFFDSFGRPFSRRDICEMCTRKSNSREHNPVIEYPLFNSLWRDIYSNEIFNRLAAIHNISKFEISCENTVLSFAVNAFKHFCGKGDNEKLLFVVSENSDKLTAICGKTEFTHEKLLSVASLYELRSGSVIKLPWNAPSFLAELNEFDGKIMFGEYVGAFDGAWAFDAFFLAVKVLEAISATGKTLNELLVDVPEFFISQKSLDIDVQPCTLAESSDADLLYRDGVAHIKTNHGKAKIIRDMYRNKLHIITEAVNSEFSEELSSEVMKIINDAALDNNNN